MRNVFSSITVLLLFLSTSALSNDRDTPWVVSWPFFQNAQAPHSINGGYGDWCIASEGAHPGLDFGATPGDSVLLPTDETRKVIYVASGAAGHAMVFGEDSTCTEGWGIAHLFVDNDGIYPFNGDSVVMNHQTLAPCFQYGSPVPVPLHMHLQWAEVPLLPYPPGLFNPFDYFENSLTGYDEVQFKRVVFEDSLLTTTNRGAWFTPDGFESYFQLGLAPGNPDREVFQDIVSGAIDIAVSPFSAFQGLANHDSAGVYSVSYEILRQDPRTLNYVPAAPDTGNFGERFLMEMRDDIPQDANSGDCAEYRALFCDGQRLIGAPSSDKYDFENAYIVTNSGALDSASWTTGWDNVWITSFINDWEDGICQGAWDTFLANPGIAGDPTQNSEAFFPDGKYAVKVTAVSHASRDTVSMRLPVDNLSLPDPQVEGVIVDNFLPYIVRVAAYTWNPSEHTCHKIYAGYWDDINPARQLMTEFEYLEQLKQDLYVLQSGNQYNAIPSYCVIDLPESFSQSSLEHYHQADRNRLSRDNSDGTGDFEPGCCLDEGIRQDPIDQLLAEITRIENQQIREADSDRTFDDRVYGYLPRNGLPLVLQVFYSEPTMTEKEGESISDRVYFRSCIGPDTSYSQYTFTRLPGGFELPLPSDATANSEIESSNVLFDSSNVVYYINKRLPSQYMGNIQLYFGDADLGDDEGPRDLAEHTIDSDPSTAANTRNSYAPFSNNGYEDGQDLHYSWDPPNWYHHTSTDIVYGTVGIEQDLVATVDLNSIGLEDAWFAGDCDYWCGFWMYRDVYDEYGFDIYVVKHDGSYIDYPFNTPYPVGGINYEQNWFGGSRELSPDSRYFWMTGNTIDLIDEWSTAYAYCVDSETGARIDGYELCSGYCFWGPRGSICCSGAGIINIDSTNAVAQIWYGYYETMLDTSSTIDTLYLPPPGGSDDILFGDMCCASDISSDAEEAIEILSNPVRETLGVRLVGVSGDNFELLLYDIAGRQILSESGILRDDESVLSIGVQNLPSGVYLLRITAGTAEVRKTVSIIH